MDIVRARGLVTSSAWGEPHLLRSPSEGIDGMLDLIFQASAPPTWLRSDPSCRSRRSCRSPRDILQGHPRPLGLQRRLAQDPSGVARSRRPRKTAPSASANTSRPKAPPPRRDRRRKRREGEDLPYPLRSSARPTASPATSTNPTASPSSSPRPDRSSTPLGLIPRSGLIPGHEPFERAYQAVAAGYFARRGLRRYAGVFRYGLSASAA